jgi:hypothetical protein
LPISDQLRLLELIAREVAESNEAAVSDKHDIMELHGLGAEIWEGVDAQEYVNELRREWHNCRNE